MISINNGFVFIDGKQTTNPELIGYAMLDFAETLENDDIKIDVSHLEKKYTDYLKQKNKTYTYERRKLIELLFKLNEFYGNEFTE